MSDSSISEWFILVGGLEHQFYFPIIIIPIDELIFFRGVALAHQPEFMQPPPHGTDPAASQGCRRSYNEGDICLVNMYIYIYTLYAYIWIYIESPPKRNTLVSSSSLLQSMFHMFLASILWFYCFLAFALHNSAHLVAPFNQFDLDRDLKHHMAKGRMMLIQTKSFHRQDFPDARRHADEAITQMIRLQNIDLTNSD